VKIIDSNIKPLPGTNGRFVHLGTIHNGLREFICMVDKVTEQCYIEEITGGHLSFIEDDSLALALAKFCEEQNIISMNRVFRSD